MPEVWVQSFTHLKDMPRADTALDLLKKTASLVKPIMRKHGWVLPVLAEFFPDNPSLLGLNVNMGQQILVRLRYPNSPDAFFNQEDVVGTLLHELTHNVHGPHDDKFYKYLAGLQDEYDASRMSGYAGEGFYSEGRRLGGNLHNVPQHLSRIKALEAAEKRRQNSHILGNAGNRLGGTGRNYGLSPREMAARAAEQRAGDERSCGSGALAQREAEKAAKASVESKVIDLTGDQEMNFDSDSDIIIVGDKHPRASGSSNVRQSGAKLKEWSCLSCTLLNAPNARQCDVCDSPRPKIDKSSVKQTSLPKPLSSTTHLLDRSKLLPLPDWLCSECTLLNPYEFWSCGACGTIKAQS